MNKGKSNCDSSNQCKFDLFYFVFEKIYQLTTIPSIKWNSKAHYNLCVVKLLLNVRLRDSSFVQTVMNAIYWTQ